MINRATKAIFSLLALSLTISCQKVSSNNNKTLAEELGYTKDDILVIVNMDDIGVHKDETDASYEVIKYGMSITGSIMVPTPDFERAAKLAGNTPLGLHITLTNEWEDKLPWSPLLPIDEVPSLYNPQGRMWKNEILFAKNAKPEDVKKEMEAQIKKALDYKLNITHIDSHMLSLYQTDEIYRVALDLAKKYKLPITCPFNGKKRKVLEDEGYIFTDSFIGFYKVRGEKLIPSLRFSKYARYLKKLKPGVHYIYTHPAYRTDALKTIMPDLDRRVGDYNAWISSDLMEIARSRNIKFIDYTKLKELQATRFSN